MLVDQDLKRAFERGDIPGVVRALEVHSGRGQQVYDAVVQSDAYRQVKGAVDSVGLRRKEDAAKYFNVDVNNGRRSALRALMVEVEPLVHPEKFGGFPRYRPAQAPGERQASFDYGLDVRRPSDQDIEVTAYRKGDEIDALKKRAAGEIKYKDKLMGSVLGFAIGDAMGAPVEFMKEGVRVEDYQTSPRKGLGIGQFTDDTQHLMIGLESLAAFNGDVNLADQADRLARWYKSGEARSMGRTTRLAIENIISGIPPTKSGINHPNSCGSLALARLVPASLMSALNSYQKLERGDIRKLLAVTHAHKNVLNMGEMFNYFVQEVMHGKTPRETANMILFEDNFLNRRLRGKLSNVLDLLDSDVDSGRAIDDIGNGGFVEDVVYSSLYGAMKGTDFRDAVLISANGGGDTDSRAALTGALFGLDVGERNIPSDLKDRLEDREKLEKLSKGLFYLRK